ncbi:MAG TPA: nucleotidyltransferase domain-containing protein [Candidatus Nanoarchaeia archaeon]|nr:nucleotidyltransferase domain-containing protein [Candidatus Nanoarchaeia archaeon]
MDKTIHNNGQLKKEIALLIPFIKEPWKGFTLTEIKLRTKKKSHHYVYEALEKFSKTILKKEKKGNTNIYHINENATELDYFLLAEIALKDTVTLPIKIIQQIQNKIKWSFYTLLVTGSYAKNKQTKESDLDLAIIIPTLNKKPYEVALKEGELTIPEVHGFVFTEEEFYQMLINKEFNYGKECVKNHIIIYGFSAYYKILLRGLQHGFKG